MNYEIEPGQTYLITEKPNNDTPKELEQYGRAKAGSGFYEYASCPYDETRKKYDTGLDRTSREFVGKDKKQVDKILEERQDLIDHLEWLKGDSLTETQVLADPTNKLKVSHNKLIDTSDPHNYFKLFLAMRGTTITPESDRGNVAKYSKSNYQIVNTDKQRDFQKELREKKDEAIRWLYKKLDSNRKEAVAFLRYTGVLRHGTDKEDSLLTQTFLEKIKDYEFLKKFIYAIRSTKRDDVYLYNDIYDKINSGKIERKNGEYIYDGVQLGANIQGVVQTLKKKENKELLTALVG